MDLCVRMRSMRAGEEDIARRRGRIWLGRNRFGIGLVVVVVFGFAVRAAYVLTIGQRIRLGPDAIWYELQAGTIANGSGYVDPHAYYGLGHTVATANFPPMWPIVLALANKAGAHTQTAYQIVGAAIGSITVALAGLLGRRVAGPSIGLAAALIVACCPMLIAADGSIMSDTLYVAFVTAALLASYWALGRPSVARFGLVGLLVGLATLTRGDGLFLAPILAVALVWRMRSSPMARRVLLGACLLGVVCVTQLPWIVSSSVRLGGVVLVSSNSGSMLEGANCPQTYGGPLIGEWDPACQEGVRAPGLSELQWSAASRSAGVHFARTHLGRLPVVVAARELRVWGLWTPVPQARLESIESRDLTWQLVGWAYDLLVLAIAVPGTVILVRRRSTIAPLVAVVVAVIVTAALSYGSQRFRLAAEPAVAVAAAAAVVFVGQTLAGRRVSGTPLVGTGPGHGPLGSTPDLVH